MPSAICGTCYLSADYLGSVRLVTDSAGKEMARHDYLPFGEEVPANAAGRNGPWGSGSDNIAQKFTGKERDANGPGFDFFGARYYNAVQGRFNSADPGMAGADPLDPQSWNAYAYVGNRPLNATDPTGMTTCDANGDNCQDSVDVNGGSPDPIPLDWGGLGGLAAGSYGSNYRQPPTVVQTVQNALNNVGNFLTAPRDPNCVQGAAVAGAGTGAAGGEYLGGAGGGTAGAVLGSVIPGFGNVTGALGGAALGATGGAAVGGSVGYLGGIAVGYVACSSSTGNGGGGGATGGGKNGWTNQFARQKASELGFNESKGAPFNSHGQPTFKSGNRWITPDVDGHSGFQSWKMFNSAGRRIGTYSTDLSIRIGS